MEYRTVRDAPTSELIRSLVGSYDTARVVRLGGQSCILAREETIAQEIDKRIPIPTVQPAPVSGWQPIESAPRDGTLVVVIVDGYPEFARWNRQKDYWETTVRFVNPTHWLPLLPLPEVPR